MDLFDILREQMDTVRLPLVSVTVTAVAQVNTPLVASLHWHGFRRATPLALPDAEIPPQPRRSGIAGRTVYRLGEVRRILRPRNILLQTRDARAS